MELLSVMRRKYPKEVEKEMDRLVLLNRDNVIHILNSIPSSIMSGIYKEWVEKLLLFRKEWILTWRNGSE